MINNEREHSTIKPFISKKKRKRTFNVREKVELFDINLNALMQKIKTELTETVLKAAFIVLFIHQSLLVYICLVKSKVLEKYAEL